jgi:hypothetical protein
MEKSVSRITRIALITADGAFTSLQRSAKICGLRVIRDDAFNARGTRNKVAR